jgi:DNA-binding NarL/FixJ family response regulator
VLVRRRRESTRAEATPIEEVRPVIRLLLADDNAFVRGALASLFTAAGDMQVVAECDDGDAVVAAAEETRPEVVLLDLTMRRIGGFEAAQRLLAVQPDSRIVFLTATASVASVRGARELGAVGYLLKAVDPAELCQHVRRVANGGTAWNGHTSGAWAGVT